MNTEEARNQLAELLQREWLIPDDTSAAMIHDLLSDVSLLMTALEADRGSYPIPATDRDGRCIRREQRMSAAFRCDAVVSQLVCTAEAWQGERNMSTPLEAAEMALREWERDKKSTSFARQPAARNIIVAFVRAAVGCPTCDGTGEVPFIDHPYEGDGGACRGPYNGPIRCGYGPSSHERMRPCPAEHVELTILGETIWADPDKCESRCVTHNTTEWQSYPNYCITYAPGDGLMYVEPDDEDLERSGQCVEVWQPRMDALFGEADDDE